jgi:hypothetical protein
MWLFCLRLLCFWLINCLILDKRKFMTKKSRPPKRTHVVKRDSGWAVKKEGAQRATKVYRTKEQAERGA